MYTYDQADTGLALRKSVFGNLVMYLVSLWKKLEGSGVSNSKWMAKYNYSLKSMLQCQGCLKSKFKQSVEFVLLPASTFSQTFLLC